MTMSVHMRMKEAGLHAKFSEDATLLADFKKYLVDSLNVNGQQEVRALYALSAHQFQQCAICLVIFHDVNATISSPPSSQVNNVSRFLRYMQPSGEEVTLDFLTKTSETQDFLTRLQSTNMSMATVHNYINNILQFLDYLRTRLDLEGSDPQLRDKCQAYKELLQTLRRPVVKRHFQAVFKTT